MVVPHDSHMHAKCVSIEASVHIVASLGRALAVVLPYSLRVAMHVQLPS